MGKRKKSQKAKAARLSAPVDTVSDSYEVEVIVAVKPIPDIKGRFYYFIQWAGYPGENSWEPRENIDAGCSRLLMSLWRELGAFDINIKSNTILEPSKEWIDAEIQYFRKMCTKSTCGTWHHQPAIGYNEETGQLNIYD